MTEFEDEADLRARLEELRAEHRALDEEIAGGDLGPMRNQLLVTRLKRRKLALKDEIARLMDRLQPDIIA
jgi:hypothetical protein